MRHFLLVAVVLIGCLWPGPTLNAQATTCYGTLPAIKANLPETLSRYGVLVAETDRGLVFIMSNLQAMSLDDSDINLALVKLDNYQSTFWQAASRYQESIDQALLADCQTAVINPAFAEVEKNYQDLFVAAHDLEHFISNTVEHTFNQVKETLGEQ